MAQKKKAPVSPKSAAKTAVRKAVPLKMAASTQKSAKPAKAKVEATPKPSKAAAKSVKKVQPAASKAAPKAEVPVAKKALTPAAHLAARAAAAPQRSMTVPAGAHKPASQKLTTPVAAAAQPASPTRPSNGRPDQPFRRARGGGGCCSSPQATRPPTAR